VVDVDESCVGDDAIVIVGEAVFFDVGNGRCEHECFYGDASCGAGDVVI